MYNKMFVFDQILLWMLEAALATVQFIFNPTINKTENLCHKCSPHIYMTLEVSMLMPGGFLGDKSL